MNRTEGFREMIQRAFKVCSGSPLKAFGTRGLCSDGRRYVGSKSPDVFVEEGNQDGQAWPPVTEQGFVPEASLYGQVQIPPTQAGFVDGYVQVQAPENVDYGSYTSYQYSQVPPGYGYVQQPPPPQVPYPQAQGQFYGENPWYHSAAPTLQATYVYGQPAPPPVQDHFAYVYHQHVAYTQTPQPPPYGYGAYQAQAPGYEGYQHFQQTPVQPEGVQHAQHVQQLSYGEGVQNAQQPYEGYQHFQQTPVQPESVQHAQHVQQLSYGEGVQNAQQPWYSQGVQHAQQPYYESSYSHMQAQAWPESHTPEQTWPGTGQVPQATSYVQMAVSSSEPAETPVQARVDVVHVGTERTILSEEVSSSRITEELAEASFQAEVTEVTAETELGEMPVERAAETSAVVETPSKSGAAERTVAGEPASKSFAAETPSSSSDVTAEALKEEAVSSAASDVEQEGSDDHEPEEYDATAAAMAEAGFSTRDYVADHSEDNNDQKSEPLESEAAEVLVHGLQSLLDVETSKAAPAPPPSQNVSFLELLSKTNQVRQTRPRIGTSSFRSPGKTHAKLFNLPRQILTTDIISYFSELNLHKKNIHISYDERFYPIFAQVAFDSNEALRSAQKMLQTKGRLGGRIIRMEPFVPFLLPGHPQIKDNMKKYLGRMVLVLHLPPEGRIDDLERFFDSYGYDPSALSMLDPIHMTLARFPKEGNRLVRRAAVCFFSSLEAMRAIRERQGDFLLNEPVELRLIQ